MRGLVKKCLGCDAVGLPEPGYSFFVCCPCLDRLADVIEFAEYVLPEQSVQVS